MMDEQQHAPNDTKRPSDIAVDLPIDGMSERRLTPWSATAVSPELQGGM